MAMEDCCLFSSLLVVGCFSINTFVWGGDLMPKVFQVSRCLGKECFLFSFEFPSQFHRMRLLKLVKVVTHQWSIMETKSISLQGDFLEVFLGCIHDATGYPLVLTKVENFFASCVGLDETGTLAMNPGAIYTYIASWAQL